MYSHGMANPVGIRTFAGKEKKRHEVYILFSTCSLVYPRIRTKKVKRQDIWKASDW